MCDAHSHKSNRNPLSVPQNPERRLLLKQIGILAVAGVGISVMYEACSSGGSSTLGQLPQLTTDPSTNQVVFTFNAYPNLQQNNGSYSAVIQSQSTTHMYYVTRTTTNGAYAVESFCKHDGTQLNMWDSGAQEYACGSCGSTYDITGVSKSGPAFVATQDLTSYIGSINTTGITFTIP